MNTGTKEKLFGIARAAKIFSLSRKLTQRKLRILCYHGLWLGPGHWGDALFMSRERFTRRLELIQSLGFNVISLADAISALDTGTLCEDAVVITIDDGWYGSYKHMFPALEEVGMPFTVYAYTRPMLEKTPVFNVLIRYLLTLGKPVVLSFSEIFGEGDESYDLGDPESHSRAISSIARTFDFKVNNNAWQQPLSRLAEMLDVDLEPLLENRVFDLMTPEELSQVPSYGGTVELHTHTHQLAFDQPDQMRRTIEDNRMHLKRILDKEYEHFCYPDGINRPGIYPDLTELGIKTATTTDPGFVDQSTHRLALPRICDGESVGQIAFEAELCSVLELKRRLFSHK